MGKIDVDKTNVISEGQDELLIFIDGVGHRTIKTTELDTLNFYSQSVYTLSVKNGIEVLQKYFKDQYESYHRLYKRNYDQWKLLTQYSEQYVKYK